MATTVPRSHFLNLPAEIRENIYKLLLSPDASRIELEDKYTRYDYRPALVLFRINRQIYHESRKVFRDLNVFVQVSTSWEQTADHIAREGHVPILLVDQKAQDFKMYSLRVQVSLPQRSMSPNDDSHFVLLLDDLEKFTRIWYYADLSFESLNRNLKLTLELRDPYAPEYDEPRLSKALQRRMILPFGMVKNLQDTAIVGRVKAYAAIESELRETQATPHASPEHCLREATRLKVEGNAALTAGDARKALELYEAAWLAIHVVIAGRQRHVHAEAFFMRQLREEPFIGKEGQNLRYILRVQLVSNTCLAYYKLEDFAMCHFWGMRTIDIFRRHLGADERTMIAPEEEAMLHFPAADQMGKIYYRTGLAAKELGDDSEARRLLRVAAIYLPRDENVRKAVAATALKLG